jgi:hypothetical protein
MHFAAFYPRFRRAMTSGSNKKGMQPSLHPFFVFHANCRG